MKDAKETLWQANILIDILATNLKRDELTDTAVSISVNYAVECKPRFVLHCINLMPLT
jgi:FPC/CPF motif-containing protein YcgG